MVKLWVKICDIFFFFLLIWSCLSLANTLVYEKDVYDCSDMATRDQQIFIKLGFDADIVIDWDWNHAWVIVTICNKKIHWESTGLHPVLPRSYDSRFNITQIRSDKNNPIKLFPEWCPIGQKGIL